MKEEYGFVRTMKKNHRNAKNSYEYNQLQNIRYYFVPCFIEETYDELVFTYNIEGMEPFEKVRGMRDGDKYGLLIQILEAVFFNRGYTFSLKPENLFVDTQKRIRVMERDIAGGDEDEREKLKDIQALGGYLFQNKYSYEDLREGGLSLLKKQKNTRYLLNVENLEQAMEIFQKLQQEERVRDESKLTYVNKKRYRYSLWMLGIAVAGCTAMMVWIVYRENTVVIPQNSALIAERAYMENNYPEAADALSGIPVEHMDKHEKYLLAVVYIKGQSVDSFNAETKERLLSKLSYNGDEYLLDYWIYLGRREIDQALDIAMRLSDRQLLLYGYLQKLDLVSADHLLSGEEKMEQIEILKGKIENLAKELGIEYKEKQNE